MLVYNQLLNNVLKKIKNKNNHLQCNKIISNEISNYIYKNIEVYGMYTGVLPLGAPDPLSGILQFKVTNCEIDYNKLIIKSKVNFDLWYYQILKQIVKSTKILNAKTGVFLNIQSKVFIRPISTPMVLKNDFEKSWQIIIKNIIKNLKMSLINSIPISAYSLSGGTGMVTLIKVN